MGHIVKKVIIATVVTAAALLTVGGVAYADDDVHCEDGVSSSDANYAHDAGPGALLTDIGFDPFPSTDKGCGSSYDGSSDNGSAPDSDGTAGNPSDDPSDD
jgi:hypothetical protein